MLVRLYDLPKLKETDAVEGIEVRRPLSAEKGVVLDWVARHFEGGWTDEVDVTFARQPISSFIAVENGQLVGFASYDATRLDFFGPMGVAPDCRGRGIGRLLLVTTMQAMWDAGYAYAVIGWAGPGDFYRRHVGAMPIAESSPGIYRGMLRREKKPLREKEVKP